MALLFRAGDEVAVTGIVRFDQDADDTYIHIDVGGCSVGAPPANCKLVQHDIRVGDGIEFDIVGNGFKHRRAGIVLALSGDGHAWVDLGGGEYATRLVSTMRRIDPPAAPPPADLLPPDPPAEREEKGEGE